MKMLSLDLDFFQCQVPFDPETNEDGRPVRDLDVWTELEVEDFLETRCRLDKARPIKCCFAEKHDAMAAFIYRLREAGEFTVPFELVHIDAHSDMGGFGVKWIPILEDINPRRVIGPPEEYDHLDEGNVLFYLLSSGWIRKLTWVKLPDVHEHDRIRQLPPRCFRDRVEHEPGIPIELPIVAKGEIAQCGLRNWEPRQYAPPIPFSVYQPTEFMLDSPPDIAFFCRSPQFSVPKADRLIHVIRQYFDFRIAH